MLDSQCFFFCFHLHYCKYLIMFSKTTASCALLDISFGWIFPSLIPLISPWEIAIPSAPSQRKRFHLYHLRLVLCDSLSGSGSWTSHKRKSSWSSALGWSNRSVRIVPHCSPQQSCLPAKSINKIFASCTCKASGRKFHCLNPGSIHQVRLYLDLHDVTSLRKLSPIRVFTVPFPVPVSMVLTCCTQGIIEVLFAIVSIHIQK